jgi:hypothetical protein
MRSAAQLGEPVNLRIRRSKVVEEATGGGSIAEHGVGT